MQKNLAPIVLFCYKRLDLLQTTIEYLLKNKLSKESDLIIFCDGAKNKEDEKLVNNVKNYLKQIKGFKNIELNFSEKNKGLANSIINGVSKVLERYSKVIVLEDDIVVNEYFLEYMNNALEKYRNEENIACIHGYQFNLKNANKLDETFFIKGADCWGWATWKRVWSNVEWNGQILLDQIKKNNLEKEINMNDSYEFTQMLEDQIAGKNDSWAIRWYISCFLQNKLCLYPYKTLIQNIGINSAEGTHCIGNQTSVNIKIELENYLPKLTDKIEFNRNGYLYMSETMANFQKISIFQKIKNKLFYLFKKAIKSQ